MLNLVTIQTFIAVVEYGNFSKAADQLQVSPMAISKQVRQLEGILGVTLFERSTRKMILTSSGMALFEQFKELVESLGKIVQFAKSNQTMPQGTLTVLSPHYLGETVIIPHLSEFFELYPHINLQLKLSNLNPDFSKNADIAFGFSFEDLGTQAIDLRHMKLMTFTRKIYASKKYLEKYGLPKNLKDCNGHRYIVNFQRKNDEFLNVCEKNQIRLRPIISCNSAVAMINSCAEGLGLASIADFVVANIPKEKRPVEIKNLINMKPTDSYIFYKNSRFVETKITCFKEFFKNKIFTNLESK